MKLHYHPLSQPSRASYAVAKHLGLEVETQVVDLLGGEQRSPEYLAINPNGKVPALVDGDLKLWESLAIQLYFCEKAGETSLWPTDPAARADVERWRVWSTSGWNMAIAKITFQRLFRKLLMGTEPDEAVIAEGEKEFRDHAGLLEAHLKDRSWLCGDGVTLADFAVAAMLTHWEPAKVPLPEFAAVRAWYARVEELPAWVETRPVYPEA